MPRHFSPPPSRVSGSGGVSGGGFDRGPNRPLPVAILSTDSRGSNSTGATQTVPRLSFVDPSSGAPALPPVELLFEQNEAAARSRGPSQLVSLRDHLRAKLRGISPPAAKRLYGGAPQPTSTTYKASTDLPQRSGKSISETHVSTSGTDDASSFSRCDLCAISDWPFSSVSQLSNIFTFYRNYAKQDSLLM